MSDLEKYHFIDRHGPFAIIESMLVPIDKLILQFLKCCDNILRPKGIYVYDISIYPVIGTEQTRWSFWLHFPSEDAKIRNFNFIYVNTMPAFIQMVNQFSQVLTSNKAAANEDTCNI